MAHFRLEKKIISRQGGKHSVLDFAAYQCDTPLYLTAAKCGKKAGDKAAPRKFDREPLGQVVLYSQILAPKDGPDWLQDIEPTGREDAERQRAIRERLWNRVEEVERRKDSQLALLFIGSLVRGLTLEQRIELVRGWVHEEFVSKGFVADVAFHDSLSSHNPHFHLLVTTRPVAGQDFGKKPETAGKFNGRGMVGLTAKSELVRLRESYAKHENAALEKAGRPERVDHRSLVDRGIDRIPEPKLGIAATAMKRRGQDSERFTLWRYVKSLNFSRPWLKAIEKSREIHQQGMGKTWWERSLIFMSEARHAVRESVLDTWRAMLLSRQPGGPEIPPPQRGPDLSR